MFIYIHCENLIIYLNRPKIDLLRKKSGYLAFKILCVCSLCRAGQRLRLEKKSDEVITLLGLYSPSYFFRIDRYKYLKFSVNN